VVAAIFLVAIGILLDLAFPRPRAPLVAIVIALKALATLFSYLLIGIGAIGWVLSPRGSNYSATKS